MKTNVRQGVDGRHARDNSKMEHGEMSRGVPHAWRHADERGVHLIGALRARQGESPWAPVLICLPAPDQCCGATSIGPEGRSGVCRLGPGNVAVTNNAAVAHGRIQPLGILLRNVRCSRAWCRVDRA